jgi:phospholipase A1
VKKLFLIWIITFLHVNLLASELTSLQMYQKASELEKSGNFEEAMKWYKKAASISLHVKDEESIIVFGKNNIESYENNATNETLEQIIFSNFDFQAYQANYLMPFTYDFDKRDGRKQSETKFQLSFKKPLAKNFLGLQETLYLGYTQTSWWQTSQNSAPFRESNYRPEIFIEFPYLHEKTALKAYSIGLLHESNGRDGLSSRSWNRIYLKGIFQYNGLFITPRAWYRLPEDKKTNINDTHGDDNHDIHNYLGYGDLKITLPYKKSLFNLLIRNNLRFKSTNKGAYEFDWTFPIPWVNDLYGYFYYFNGYGESLIDYDKKMEKVGFGFSITR